MRKALLVNLGSTGLRASKLGFGTFDFGVSSLKVSPEEGGRILTESYDLGVNLWDTADDYGSHPHVASALKRVPRKQVVVSTKTSAKSGAEAKKNLREALKQLETDYIDIFLAHNVKFNWIDDCCRMLKELNALKTSGTVRAVGLSTHSVSVVRKACEFEEVDVIMAICCGASQATINKFRDHIPLEDGSITEMLHALALAHRNGKGIIAMKVLGGCCTSCGVEHEASPLVKRYKSSIKTIAKLGSVDSMVIGMRNIDEVKKNLEAFQIRFDKL